METVLGLSIFAAIIFGCVLSNLARPKTKVCRRCRQVIDTKADTCPYCRNSQPSTLGIYWPGAIKFGAAAFVIVFVIASIANLFS